MNDIHVRIKATANTGAASKEINSLAAQVRRINQDQRNALNIISGSGLSTQPLSRIRNELDSVTESINKGKISGKQFGTVWRNQSRIIQRQSALSTARLASMNDQIRGFRQGTLIFDNFTKAKVRMTDRVRLLSAASVALSRHVVDLGKNMQWAGRQITVGFTVPFAIAAGLAAREFIKVEDQIVRFQKVFNENLGTPLNEATDRVKTLASTITTEMARAQTETLEVAATFAQMGKEIDEVESMTRETMRLSTLGEVNTETSTNLVRGIQAVFRFTNDELKTTVDMLNAVENNTALTVDAMAQAMPQLLPIFKQFNLSLGEGTAMLAGMNEILGNANEAATAFKAIAQRMFDPTQEAVDKFAQYGIDLRQIVSNNADDLQGFLVDLGNILEENNVTAQEFAETFGNLMGVRQAGRGLSLILSTRDALSGVENDASRAYSVLETGAENAADAQIELDRQMNSLPGQFRKNVEEMKIAIADLGRSFLEMAMPIIRGVRAIIQWIQGMDEKWRKFILTIAAVTAAVGPLVMGLGIFINLAGTVFGFLAKMLPRAHGLTTAAAKASTLAINEEATAATALMNKMFGVKSALDDATLANQRFASSTVSANQAMAGGGPRVVQGQWVKGPTGQMARVQNTQDSRGRFAGRAQFGPEKPSAAARQSARNATNVRIAKSTQRSKTSLAGGFGMASTMLFMTSAIANQSGIIESNFANALNNVVMIGAGLGMALPPLTRLIMKSNGLAGIFNMVGSSIAGIFGKSIGVTGSVALGAGGLIAAVGAVGLGIRRWVGHIDTAANRMENMRNVVNDIGDDLGLERRGSTLVKEVDELGNVVEKDITSSINRAIDAMAGASGAVARRRAQTIVFDLVTRGADKETVEKIVDAMEREGQFTLNVDLSDAETAIDNMAQAIKTEFTNVFNMFANGDFNSSFAGRIFQQRDMSQLGRRDMENMGAQFSSVLMSGNREIVREMVDFLEVEINKLSAIETNYFVDEVLMSMGLERFVDEVNDLDSLLSTVSGRLGEEVTGELAEYTREQHAARTAFTEAATEYSNASNRISGETKELGYALVRMHDNGQLTTNEFRKLEDAIQRLAVGTEPTQAQMDLLESVMHKINANGDLSFTIRNLDHMNQYFASIANSGPGFLNFLQRALDLFTGRQSIRDLTREANRVRLHADSEAAQAKLEADLAELDFSTTPPNLEDAGEDEAQKAASELQAKRGAINEVLNDYISKVIEGLNEQKDAIKERYDDEIDRIKKTQEAHEESLKSQREEEKKLEDQRIKAFEDELARMRRLSDEMSNSIDLDAAIARGETDTAARISQEMMFGDVESAFDEFKDAIDARSNERDEEVEDAIQTSSEIADARIEATEKARDAALEAHEERVEQIREELEELKRITPATLEEWNEKMSKIDGIVTRFGGSIDAKIRQFGVEGWQTALDRWQTELDEDARWEAMGKAIEDGMGDALSGVPTVVQKTADQVRDILAEALFGENYADIFGDQWADLSADMADRGGILDGADPAPSVTPPPRTYTPGDLSDFSNNIFHSGGGIGGTGEIPAILEGGEFVMNKDSVGKYGVKFMESINAQRWHEGGPVGGLFGGGAQMGGIMGMFQRVLSDLLGGMGGLFGGLGGLLGGLLGGGQQNYGGQPGRNPVPGGRVISEFGDPRGGGRRHLGIDIAARRGSPIVSAFSGQVVKAGVGSGGFGKRVWVHSPQNGLFHAYAHMDSIRARDNQPVGVGTMLGTVGDTGNAKGTPPHLHWSANKNSSNSESGSINPRRLLQLKKGGSIKMDNVLANLHKGEHVLRAPTSKALESGIKKMENVAANAGGMSLYIGEFHGTDDNIQKLVREVEKAIDKKQNRRGPRRSYG